MTTPICCVTLRLSQNNVIGYFPGYTQPPFERASTLLENLKHIEVLTTSGPVDDELFKGGFAFAISLGAYSAIYKQGKPVETIEKILKVFASLGHDVISYNNHVFYDQNILENMRFVTEMYSDRFFLFSESLSHMNDSGNDPKANTCSCDCELALLMGLWHSSNCDMFSDRDIPTRYQNDPPSCTIILNGEYGIDSITVALRDGLFQTTRLSSGDEAAFGNIISDLNTLVRGRFVDYLETLGYSVDTSQLPVRWVKGIN